MAEEQPQTETPEGTQAPPADEGSEQGGFSEAFAERSAQIAGENKPPETQAAAPAAAPEGKPAEEAGQTQAPSKEAAAPVADPKAPAFDPYAGMSPELKAYWERVAASERSNRGRVGALTKKVNGLTGTQTPPAKTETDRKGDAEGADSSKPAGEETSTTDRAARLKAATEEYGDIVGPLTEEIEEFRKELNGLKASTTRHEVDADAAAQAEAYGELEKAHPDFRDYGDQNPAFVEWFKEQPAGVQALVNSFDPREVSLGLNLFKAESKVVSVATTETDEGKGGTTATGDRRERQLDGLAQPANRGAPAAAGVPNDFSSAFKVRAEQIKQGAVR